jgi:glucokinase
MLKIGVDLGGTNIRAGLIDDHKVERIKKISLKDKENLESTLSQLTDLIDSVFDPEISGIGIGVPSVVDIERGIVFDVVNIPSWKEVHLKHILETRFDVPVHINNDSNCFVLGEKYFGAGKGYQNIVGITIGTGLGGGIIINGKLFSGVNCGAGEIGYLPYRDRDLEHYCSSNFFEKIHKTTAYDSFLLAEKGDSRALNLWEEFGHNMGWALKAVMYAYDPEIIILGGSISAAYPYFKKSMFATLDTSYYPKSVDRLKICLSEIDNAPMLGAAALVDHQLETAV